MGLHRLFEGEVCLLVCSVCFNEKSAYGFAVFVLRRSLPIGLQCLFEGEVCLLVCSVCVKEKSDYGFALFVLMVFIGHSNVGSA